MTLLNALADADLSQIFKWLPPYDRLRVSEVCRRWYFISQDSWHEVNRLELDSSIPSASIAAIVRMAPNLTSLFCKDQRLILDDLRNITLASLKSVSYHNCNFISHDHSANKTALPLFRSQYGQSMEELILHEHNYGVETRLSESYSQRLLPVSIKRLQMSGLNKDKAFERDDAQVEYLIELSKLRSLECLLLESNCGNFSTFVYTIDALRSLSSLRELMLPTDCINYLLAQPQFIGKCAMNLPKLEILVLPEKIPGPYLWQDVLLNLFAKHPMLRILVIPGKVESSQAEVQVPIRKRFPHGLAADPLPLLHVFVGKSAANLFRFDDSPANWLRVHPISAPFPELLEREEIAEVFGDSWIAKQIKAGAKCGIKFWNYEDNLACAQMYVILIRGLPDNATYADIKACLSGFEISPECVQFQQTPDGRWDGDVIVELASRSETERAVREKQGNVVGGCLIHIFPCSL